MKSAINATRHFLKRRATQFILTAMLVTGCSIPMGSKVGELNETFTGQQLVIYRPADSGGLYFPVILNGKAVRDSLTGGSVNVVPITVGRHQLTVELPPLNPGSTVNANVLPIDIAPGERKFVRLRLVSFVEPMLVTILLGPGIGTWNFKLEEVDAPTAREEIRNLKFTR